jgi:hypothetical protein
MVERRPGRDQILAAEVEMEQDPVCQLRVMVLVLERKGPGLRELNGPMAVQGFVSLRCWAKRGRCEQEIVGGF